MKTRKEILKEFQKLPNVGPSIAQDLVNIGYSSIAQFKGKDPETIYNKLEKYEGTHVDRCMLYVLRSLVYMAETGKRDMKSVAWWLFIDI